MERIKNIVGEFMRYLLVGGIAFIADFLVLCLCQEYLFQNLRYGLYLATAIGFITGLSVNYILSITFVFASAKTTNAGKSIKDMIVFSVVGIVGLLLSELGMFIGADILSIQYQIVKLGVTVIMLLWNYMGRKFLIFNKAGKPSVLIGSGK